MAHIAWNRMDSKRRFLYSSCSQAGPKSEPRSEMHYQSESAIHIHIAHLFGKIFGFPSHLGPHRALSRVPCATCVIYFISCCLVAQSCLILCYPIYCNPPGPSVHRISEARSSVYMSVPISRFIQSPSSTPGIHKSIKQESFWWLFQWLLMVLLIDY